MEDALPIRRYTGGVAQTNAYLLGQGERAILIDAPKGTSQWLDSLGEKPQHLLLTHQHYDHVEDAALLQKKGLTLYAWKPHSSFLTLEERLKAAGFDLKVTPYVVDKLLEGEEKLTLNGWDIQLFFIPGHATDGMAFYTEGFLFSGDTLFARSIGRCDLPGGDAHLLIEGIERDLLSLPDETLVFSGHGEQTTIGEEKAYNAFL